VRGWEASCVTAPFGAARFARYATAAAVELAPDARARREAVDADAVVATASSRIGRVRDALCPSDPPALDSAAHLAEAAATLTRLGQPDPDAWADAARRWEQLGDQLAIAGARLHEADAAAATGAAARAAEALRAAHAIAAALDAAPLLAQIDAVSRRTRIGLDAADPVALDVSSVTRLGLTPREAEVLALVTAGRTNRQIGEALYVSEKTASVHVSNILRKLGVTTRVEAAAVAQRLGLD
jgi:DNA-binding CsgD family transcriptional regulator